MSSFPQRLRHFIERLFGEFDGDVAEWIKESEPILSLRVDYVRVLEYLNFFTFYPVFGFMFLLATPRIYRVIDRYVDKMKGKLLRKDVNWLAGEVETLQQSIAVLEESSATLKHLEGLARVLFEKDVHLAPLTENEIKILQRAIAHGFEIFQLLSRNKDLMLEFQPEEFAEIGAALVRGKAIIDSVQNDKKSPPVPEVEKKE